MKQEIYSLSCLKGICAMLVVLIHTHMAGKVALIPFYRSAVPLFFMISGYFLMGGGNWRQEKIRQAIKRMLLIWVAADVVYILLTQFIFTEYNVLHNSTGIVRTLCMEAVFGGQFCYPLWYVTAYVWALVILSFWRCRLNKFSLGIVVLLLLANVLLGAYRFLLPFEITDNHCISNNFLTTALPFILLGGFLRLYSQKPVYKRILSVKILGCLLVLCYAELAFLYFVNCREGDVFLTTPILSALILGLFAQHPNWGKDSLVRVIGKKYSLNIYLLHVIVIWTIGACCEWIGINTRNYEYLLVLPVTVLICHILEQLKLSIK